MSSEAALVAMLDANVTLNGLVGSGVNARIYPQKIPQEVTETAIAYRQVSGGQFSCMDGAVGLNNPTFVVHAWSPDYDLARSAAAAVLTALHCVKGTFATVVVQGVFQQPLTEDMISEPMDAGEEGTHAASQAFQMWHQ